MGYPWSCSACRMGHLVPIWQPIIGYTWSCSACRMGQFGPSLAANHRTIVPGHEGLGACVGSPCFEQQLPRQKPIGCSCSSLACRIGHSVPVWQLPRQKLARACPSLHFDGTMPADCPWIYPSLFRPSPRPALPLQPSDCPSVQQYFPLAPSSSLSLVSIHRPSCQIACPFVNRHHLSSARRLAPTGLSARLSTHITCRLPVK
jgi:hypothetical protein